MQKISRLFSKTTLGFAALLLGGSLAGQSMNDIYNLQRSSILYGTPRFMGMGGAFGALGGELSSTQINPAGGAVAVKSEVSITFGPEWYDNSTSFYGSKANTNPDSKFSLFQGGANFVFTNDNPYSSIAGFNVGINYSRRHNFNNEFSVEGRNRTITDWFEGMPIGSSLVESFFRNAIDGVNGTVTGLATDLGVLEVVGNDIFPSADYLNIDQIARITTSGYSAVATFSAGMNLNNRVYLGIGFDYYSLELDNNNIQMDEYGYTANDSYLFGGLSNLYYDRFSGQTGWGSAVTLGIIGRVTDAFRLGFSWKSPTRFYIDENYSYGMGAKFFDGTLNEGSENPTYYYPNSYSFKTPSEWTFSAAYVVGQYGMVSVDYMLKDFSKMRFKSSGFEAENQIIADQMQIAHTVRVGAEVRLFPVSLRAGFNYSSSPYKDLVVQRVSQAVAGQYIYPTLPQGTGDTMGFSAGAGYSIGNFLTIDLTYVNNSHKTYTYLYEPQLTDPIENDITAQYVAIGATLRF